MKRITQWQRIEDRWRVRLPVPRYLRHSPLRAMRERFWFVSRLQPKVDVTVNLAHILRVHTPAAPPTTVFLHQWLTAHTAAPEAARRDVAARSPQMSTPLMRMSPLARLQAASRPASVAIPALKPPSAPGLASEGPARAIQVLVRSLAGRMRRMDDLTPAAAARVVRRNPDGAVSEAISSAREVPGWLESRRGVPPVEPGGAPAAAIPPLAVNVEQLTDQVLRQLDRRLIASRERMGRI